jgi:hypothetical protein
MAPLRILMPVRVATPVPRGCFFLSVPFPFTL